MSSSRSTTAVDDQFAPDPNSNETLAWKICYTENGQYRTALCEHNSVGDYRDIDPMATSIPLVARQSLEEKLGVSPEMFAAIATAENRQAGVIDKLASELLDVKAGIPARDAEIAALRKENEHLREKINRPVGVGPVSWLGVEEGDRLVARRSEWINGCPERLNALGGRTDDFTLNTFVRQEEIEDFATMASWASAPVSAETVAHRLWHNNGNGEWVCNEWVNGWPSTETALACMNTPELCRVQLALSNAAPVAAQDNEPTLDKPAKVGNGLFGVGIKWSTVIAAAQRHYEYEVTPSKEAERIKEGAQKLGQLQELIAAQAQPADVPLHLAPLVGHAFKLAAQLKNGSDTAENELRLTIRQIATGATAQQPVSGAYRLPQGWRMVPEKIPMKGLDDAIGWMRCAMNQAGRDLAYCLTGAWSILLDSVTPPDHLPDATKTVEPSGDDHRNAVLEEAAQELMRRRALLSGQNVALNIQEGLAMYDICIDAIRGLKNGDTQPSWNAGELPQPDCLYETTNERTGFIDQEPAYRATTVRWLIEKEVRAALAQQEPRTDADRAAALIVAKLAEIIPLKDTLKATASGKDMVEYFKSALAQKESNTGKTVSVENQWVTQQDAIKFGMGIIIGGQHIPAGEVYKPSGNTTSFMLGEDRAKRIYIAGPMTGIEDFNFPAFNAAAQSLIEDGWHVENPADHGVVPGAEWEDYLAYDLTRLGTCGAIYLLPGWQASKGATLEVHIARALGMEVFTAKGAIDPPENYYGKLPKPRDTDAEKYWGGKETWVRYLTEHTGLIQITARDIATCNAALDAVRNALAPGVGQQDTGDLLQRIGKALGLLPGMRFEAHILPEIEKLKAQAWAQPQRLIFPTMLRKMWSGSEVQAWLDDQFDKLAKLTKSSSQQEADLINQLCDALELARTCHGAMLMSDPPQEMWKVRGVDQAISKALDAAIAALQAQATDQQQDANKAALDEWDDKTKFVQEMMGKGELPVKYLGWHRADVMRDLIEGLTVADYEKVQADSRRLTAELGRLLMGDDAPAQPSLCDLVAFVQREGIVLAGQQDADKVDAEHSYASKEGKRNAVSDDYFRARPNLLDNDATRSLFDDGFDRGYEAARKGGNQAQQNTDVPDWAYAGVTVFVGDKKVTKVTTRLELENSNVDKLLELFEGARFTIDAARKEAAQ